MPGILCVSIDVELAWGSWDRPDTETYSRCAELERDIVRSLILLFERYEIAATWAIVARLLDRDEHRARSTRYGDTIWYAPDVIETISTARVPQDIGSHSYAHIYFHENTTDVLRADLCAARRIHAAHALPFTSFVFPRNQVARLDLLREAGVHVYRGADHGWHVRARRYGRTLGRAAHLLEQALPIAPTTVLPATTEGLVNLPGSMLLLARNGARRTISPAVTLMKARRGIEAACRTNRTFHLWWHPSNFYFDMRRQLDTVEEVLRHAAEMRRRGRLSVQPMSFFAPS